jgi:hypothetical protein
LNELKIIQLFADTPQLGLLMAPVLDQNSLGKGHRECDSSKPGKAQEFWRGPDFRTDYVGPYRDGNEHSAESHERYIDWPIEESFGLSEPLIYIINDGTHPQIDHAKLVSCWRRAFRRHNCVTCHPSTFIRSFCAWRFFCILKETFGQQLLLLFHH